ncbi:hypothetical protein V8E36_002285 [Tilletia maclaganii]
MPGLTMDNYFVWTPSPPDATHPSPATAALVPSQDAHAAPPGSSPPPPSDHSSSAGFPLDQAAEDDPDPAESESEGSEPSSGTSLRSLEPRSSDGDDDGADVRSFDGDFPTSSIGITSSAESAKFSTTSSGCSDQRDGRAEQKRMNSFPRRSWGPAGDTEASDTDGSDSEISDSGDAGSDSSATASDPNTPSSPAPFFGPDEPGVDPGPACIASTSTAAPHLAAPAPRTAEEALDDEGFVVVGHKRKASSRPVSPGSRVKVSRPTGKREGTVICKWTHDDNIAASQTCRSHASQGTAVGPSQYKARLVRLEGGMQLSQVQIGPLLGMGPHWRWAHDVRLRNDLDAPPTCEGCCEESVEVDAP